MNHIELQNWGSETNFHKNQEFLVDVGLKMADQIILVRPVTFEPQFVRIDPILIEAATQAAWLHLGRANQRRHRFADFVPLARWNGNTHLFDDHNFAALVLAGQVEAERTPARRGELPASE